MWAIVDGEGRVDSWSLVAPEWDLGGLSAEEVEDVEATRACAALPEGATCSELVLRGGALAHEPTAAQLAARSASEGLAAQVAELQAAVAELGAMVDAIAEGGDA